MIMKKTLIILFILALTNLNAEDSPFNFLRYISDARASALGGAFVSMENDAASVYYNPAALYTVDEKKFNATFLKHVLDINSGNLSYVHDIKNYGKITGYVGYTNYGSFDYADYQGNIGGTFSANDIMMGASYSDMLDSNFYYGVGLKFIYANIEDVTASAIAVDAGLFYAIPDRRTNIGLSILHAGSQLTKIDGANSEIPLDIRLGFNHKLKGLPVLFNFNFHHLADDYGGFFEKFKSFSAGAELMIGKFIRGRVGYDNLIRSTTASDVDKGLTGISFGAGIISNTLNINYSASFYGSSTTLHRFSIGMDF